MAFSTHRNCNIKSPFNPHDKNSQYSSSSHNFYTLYVQTLGTRYPSNATNQLQKYPPSYNFSHWKARCCCSFSHNSSLQHHVCKLPAFRYHPNAQINCGNIRHRTIPLIGMLDVAALSPLTPLCNTMCASSRYSISFKRKNSIAEMCSSNPPHENARCLSTVFLKSTLQRYARKLPVFDVLKITSLRSVSRSCLMILLLLILLPSFPLATSFVQTPCIRSSLDAKYQTRKNHPSLVGKPKRITPNKSVVFAQVRQLGSGEAGLCVDSTAALMIAFYEKS